MPRVVALETGAPGRIPDAVRDRAAAESAEHRALWGGSLGRTCSSAAIASRPIRSSAPAPAWSPLLRCTVSRPVPSGWRSTSAHVSAAALERRSSASRITVTMARSMSPRRRACSAISVRPPGPVRGRADRGERLCGQRCRLPRRLASPGLPASESAQDAAHTRMGASGGAPRDVCSWAMAATVVRSVEIPAPVSARSAR